VRSITIVMRPPRCPLCDDVVDGDDTLRAHLAATHGLRDDPGTVSHVSDLADLSPAAAMVEAAPALAGAAGPQVPLARVYDPSVDDARWRPVVLAVGGLLLVLATLLAMSVA
jgi:hypothetical protein